MILLCTEAHKRIDELVDIYSSKKIKLIKKNHEEWVKSTLERDVSAFTNDKNGIRSLARVKSGKQLIDIVSGSHLFNFDYDDLKSEAEADLIGGLFEELKDFGEIASDMGHLEISKLGVRYNPELEKIEEIGFSLFGLRRKIRLRNASQDDVGVYDMATLVAIRQNNPSIVNDFIIAKFPSQFVF